MEVASLCPLRVSSLLWRASTGGFALCVIAKATYDLRPGELHLSEQQDDLNEDDNFWDDDPNRSLRAPSDLVPFKPRADVVLVGKAFAPNKVPVRSLVARLAIAGVDKSLEVHGDRAILADGSLREGAPFVSMQLRYERAVAGPDNPVGTRVDPRSGALPNLQLPGRPMDAAGFGPIAPTWRERRGKLGRHAGSFPPRSYGDTPVPEDLDASYFNVAPADQQAERLDLGERLTLEHLHPQTPRLVAELPRARTRAFVERGGGLEEVSLVCDTLWIDTDRAVCTLTWRGTIGLHGPGDEGRVSVLLEPPGRPLTWPEIQQLCRGGRAAAEDAAQRPASAQGSQRLAAPPRFAGGGGFDDPHTRADEYPRRGEGTREYVVPVREAARVDALPFDASRTGDAGLHGAAAALPFLPATSGESTASRPALGATRPPWLEAKGVALPASPDAGETLQPGALRVPVRWPREGSVDAARLPGTQAPSAPQPVPAFVMEARQVAPAPPPLTVGQATAPPLTVGQATAPPLTVGQAAAVVLQPQPVAAPDPLGASSAGALLTASNLAASEAKAGATADAPVSRADAGRASSAEIVDLLWFEAGLADRVRVHPPWLAMIARLRRVPPEPAYDDDPPEDPPEVVDRRDVFAALTDAEPTSVDDLEACVAAATTERGAFTPPLAALRGELELSFDDVETLKATVATVAPFAAGPDKRLKDAFDAATAALESPTLAASGRAVDTLTTRVREAFAAGSWSLPAGYLDQQVERSLVEQRKYQKRSLLGETWIRATMGPRGSAAPVYLPASLAGKLPLYARFAARLVVEVHLQQDQYESHPFALRGLALARTTPARGGGRRPAGR
jgi:hypothetical protein